jgi:PAS domain S-box-containing protein
MSTPVRKERVAAPRTEQNLAPTGAQRGEESPASSVIERQAADAERERLIDELRQAHERMRADLEAMTRLHELGSLFVREANLEPLLLKIVDAAIAISGADFGNIQLLDAKHSDLKIVAQRGFPGWWLEFWDAVSRGQGVCGTALERGERVVVEDVEHSPIFAGTAALEIQRRAGVRAVQATPLVSRSGKPIGMFSTHWRKPGRPDERVLRLLDLLARHAADITESALDERALRESEERFRLLVQGVKDYAVYMLAPDGTVTSWSAAAEQIFGYREEEILGQHREVFFTEEDRRAELPRRELEEATTQGRFEEEAWRVRKDGSLFWANVLITALRDDAGTLRGFASVQRDFTERKRTEAALRESEERYRSLFEHMSEGLAFCRVLEGGERPVDFVYLNVNPAFETLTGLRDVVGKKVSEVIPGIQESDPGLIERCARVARLGAPDRFEAYVESLGQWFDISLYSPARGDFVAVFDVITLRKRAEEELHASGERMRMAQTALRETDRQKNQFLAVLSHELRNPLAPIRNSLYILDRAAPGSDQAKRARAIIHRQIGQMTWLIDDLLDVTRIAHGKIKLQRERLDLNELVHRTVEDHRAVFVKSEVRLEVLPAPTEIWVDGDRVRLSQIVGNLLQNAVKFTPRGGKATVSIESDPARGQAALTVQDTGSGIEAEMLPRLFQAFTQADSTLDRGKGGLGLGLALVKGLVEMHGGSVKAASGGLGQGAAFTIHLPLDVSAAQIMAAPRGVGGASATHRVLVIEDNEDAAQTLREVLEFDEHVVEVAYSGRDGIEKARAFRPDIVLCDIGLPEMDGYQVARTMRADPELGRIGLIAVSGYAQPDDVTMAKEAGFDMHLAKPPSLEALERAIAEVGRAGA